MTIAMGTRMGPYEIISPIGAGGMGEVYRAKDTRLDRTVAVKVLPAHLSADPAFRQLFFAGADKKLWAATIQTQAGFEPETPKPLFTVNINEATRGNQSNYDIAKDGQRFLINVVEEDPVSAAVHLIFNWANAEKR